MIIFIESCNVGSFRTVQGFELSAPDLSLLWSGDKYRTGLYVCVCVGGEYSGDLNYNDEADLRLLKEDLKMECAQSVREIFVCNTHFS